MASAAPITSVLRPDVNAGRVALVTGGGTGIGRAAALELAATGAGLIVCGRREELLRETAEMIEAGGGQCLAVAADIREPEQVQRVVEAGIERFGYIDVLINNAGGQFSAPAEDINDKGWRAVQRLSVDAQWTMTRTVATNSMIPRGGGLIVFIGFSPLRGSPGFAHAWAARAAVGSLASSLALEWSVHGIRSVCLAMGSVRTTGLDKYGDDVQSWAPGRAPRAVGRAWRGVGADRLPGQPGGRLHHRHDDHRRRRRRCVGPGRATAAMSAGRSLRSLFAPASVAVLGASEDPRKWGHWLARGALTGEARRPVYLVNRRAGELLGRPAYPSLAELPGPAELVVIAVPIAVLPAAVDEALAAGARAIVAISAGASEGPEARALEASLAARVREAGAVLLGPNCLGVLDSAQQLELSSNPLPAGSIGLISQSGNLALELGQLAAAEGLGFSRFASLGNQADLTAADLLADFARHDETRLIMLYVEDFRDGRALMRAAIEARSNGKAVLALAVSDDPATARAARSHTGALASDGAVIDAACRAAGIERVVTPREMIDAAQALLRCPPAPGRRVVVLSDGGGHSSVGAAVAARAGLEVPELPAALARSLASQLPPGAAVLNPIDLAGGAEKDTHTFARVAA